ncbi:MAG: cytochrome b/b6 domain-containing protein [Candidatus Omnitrophica bacterium]|nr:cytochrome b/b6 domain-containing protein [Candidatus Omnitrophota bacterium]
MCIAVPGASARAEGIDNETCFACHGVPDGPARVEQEKFQSSVHGGHLCTSCHSGIQAVPHAVPLPAVSCSTCHMIESEVYLKSDHGRALKAGIAEAASCRDCHGDPHVLVPSRHPDSPVYRLNIPSTCAQCHEQVDEMKKFHLSEETPVASYAESVHGLALLKKGLAASAVCTDCHGSHDLHRATHPESKLNWRNIPSTCGRCHENIRSVFSRSVHGRAAAAGKREAPVCTDCHGEHTIEAVRLATSKVFPSHIPETCGQCHGAERIVTKFRMPSHVVKTYMESFHGLAVQLGSVTAAHCASCHGAHDILSSGDPRSSVHPENLAQTCGACHPGVSSQVARGAIHSGTQPGLEHRAVSWVRTFYLALIFSVIGGMLLHNVLDYRKKLAEHYRRSAAAAGAAERMGVNERVQHLFLILSFTVLAYTGFALKVPQAWWASPFMGRVDWRSGGHRWAAVLFTALAAYHLIFMLLTRRGRRELNELWPRRVDWIQPFQLLAFNLGFRRQKPVFAKYSYIEKLEYWALVWGSVIMTATGALMLRESWTLNVFPKWFFDAVTAVHYYEAILACLAILVWHLYFVMFDPDEYPMKWSWITGRGKG